MRQILSRSRLVYGGHPSPEPRYILLSQPACVNVKHADAILTRMTLRNFSHDKDEMPMFKRSDTERTPKELAERAVMRTLGRLGACGLLIYFVVTFLIQSRSETPGSSAPFIITLVFMVLAAIVIVFTIMDFVNSLKSGAYHASTYEAADIARFMANKNAENDSTDENNSNADEDSRD